MIDHLNVTYAIPPTRPEKPWVFTNGYITKKGNMPAAYVTKNLPNLADLNRIYEKLTMLPLIVWWQQQAARW